MSDERDVNRRYNVNMGNPAPGFLERAERALDDMGPFGDPEVFCPRCFAGTESSEHSSKCGEA